MQDSDLAELDGQGAGRPRLALFELAYERIEAQLVNCILAPGRFLTMNDLMLATGLGRTPVHQAVSRLAADTLILVRPRHGLQIAPIDLTRERTLLKLRRDIERFVVRLAAERIDEIRSAELTRIAQILTERRDALDLDAFNSLDRAIDREVLAAAGEPFVENTLRPLHTIFRRIGHIHHSRAAGVSDLAATVDRHAAIVRAIAAGEPDRAAAASDDLMAYVDGMFEGIEDRVDPRFLDTLNASVLA